MSAPFEDSQLEHGPVFFDDETPVYDAEMIAAIQAELELLGPGPSDAELIESIRAHIAAIDRGTELDLGAAAAGLSPAYFNSYPEIKDV